MVLSFIGDTLVFLFQLLYYVITLPLSIIWWVLSLLIFLVFSPCIIYRSRQQRQEQARIIAEMGDPRGGTGDNDSIDMTPYLLNSLRESQDTTNYQVRKLTAGELDYSFPVQKFGDVKEILLAENNINCQGAAGAIVHQEEVLSEKDSTQVENEERVTMVPDPHADLQNTIIPPVAVPDRALTAERLQRYIAPAEGQVTTTQPTQHTMSISAATSIYTPSSTARPSLSFTSEASELNVGAASPATPVSTTHTNDVTQAQTTSQGGRETRALEYDYWRDWERSVGTDPDPDTVVEPVTTTTTAATSLLNLRGSLWPFSSNSSTETTTAARITTSSRDHCESGSLTRKHYIPNEDDLSCAICQEVFGHEEEKERHVDRMPPAARDGELEEDVDDSEIKVRVLSCKHVFHDACIRGWLVDCQAICPLCKRDLTQDLKCT